MPFTLVTFHAHPDDESLLTAGTMAKAVAEGHRVVLVVATAGEVGDAAEAFKGDTGDLGAARRAELARSAEILGVHRVEFLGYRDSGLDGQARAPRGATSEGATGEGATGEGATGEGATGEGATGEGATGEGATGEGATGEGATGEGADSVDPENGDPARAASSRGDALLAFASADVDEAAARLTEILREERADVLTTYDANGGYGHADHLQVHRVGRRAGELAGTPVVLEATINRDLMQMGVELAGQLGYEVPDSFSPESFEQWFLPGEVITHAIDVSAFLPQKRASMEAHASQSTSAAGGDRSIGVFLSLPEEYFAMAFATEWYVEAGRTPTEPKADDVFATLRT